MQYFVYLYAVIVTQSLIFLQIRADMENDRKWKASMKLAAVTIASNRYYKDLSQEQRDKILQKRIKRAYGSNQRIDVSQEHFTERLEPIYEGGVETSKDTLILFGIDFLSPSSLKNMFRMEDENFSSVYINPSNCMLRYSSAEHARRAIKTNLKAQSDTSFKIEEEVENEPAVVPKEWIELKPYIYRFYYQDQEVCPHIFKDYSRKLFVRYATTREKSIGKVSINHISELYHRCKAIWIAEAHRSSQLNVIIRQKLEEFKQKLAALDKNRSVVIYEAESDRQRSRSRDRHPPASKNPGYLDKSLILTDSFDQARQPKSKLMEQEPDKNSSDLEGLIRHIERINLDCEERGDVESILHDLQNLNFDSLKMDFIQLPYKVAGQQNTRYSEQISRFKYHDYIEKTRQLEQRMKNYCQIDLTEQ